MAQIHRMIESILRICNDDTIGSSQFATSTEVLSVVCETIEILKKEEAVLKVSSSNVVVVGDLHGNLHTLVRIFNELGFPDSRSFVFLGDYIDRGSHSCEVLLLLYSLKILFPKQVILLRGNHEFKAMSECYDFRRECLMRFLPRVYSSIIDSFSYFPVAAIINDRIFCVHGGLIPNLEVRRLNKESEDILWSDPRKEISGFEKSDRGRGFNFGCDVVKEFMDRESIEFLIRSHEYCEGGFSWSFGEEHRFLTIFSSVNYCEEKNDGSVCILREESRFEIYQLPYERSKSNRRSLIPSFVLKSIQFQNIGFQDDFHDTAFYLKVNILI
jgi:diadenosine tetraphosphatase ApaH/serine/threonine PP2A family protein phosphatase